MIFTEERRGVMELIDWDRDIDDLVSLNFDIRKQQFRGGVKNNIHEE